MLLKEKNEAKLLRLERSKDVVQKVFQHIERNPIVTIREIADKFKFSYNTAANVIKALVDLKMLEQANQQTRYRIYEYKELLEILKDDC